MIYFDLKNLNKATAVFLCIVIMLSCALVPASAAETEPPAETAVLGDVDCDGESTLDDVLSMQMYFAGLLSFSDQLKRNADTNLDGETTILDATNIQYWLARIEGRYYLNMTVDEAVSAKADDDIRDYYEDMINDYTPQKGVDVSEFNGDIDMTKIKEAGYTFVMIRLGYGVDETEQDDKRFEENVRKAEAAGLDWGAYIYSYALNEKSALSELNHTLRLLKGKHPTMPIAFDWEEDEYKEYMGMPSDEVVLKIAQTYLYGVRDAGYYPILYTGYNWLKGAFNHPSILDNIDIWYAQWSSVCDYTDRPLGMWQYGGEVNYIESAFIPGITYSIDKNYCYKNYPVIIKAYGWNNFEPLVPQKLASTAADHYEQDPDIEAQPDFLNGVMGDSLRNK